MHHFFVPRTPTMSRVKPHLKVYREANPLACALALTYLRPSKYQKCLLVREKSNFSWKTSRKSWKGPSDPGSPGTSISYYSSCMSYRQIMLYESLRWWPGWRSTAGCKYEILVPGDPGSHGTFYSFWGVFWEKLDFSCRNIYFWDFLCLKHINAKAHAGGFAPL